MFHRPLFQSFFPIYRFCHPVLPSFKQYTCSAAPFLNLFYHLLNSIHVPPPPFSIFFLYTGSAILFYHLLNSIHVPPPPFFNLFSDIQVLPFWAKFSLVWFSLGFDVALVQNHKRWLTWIQRIPFRSSSQVNVETVQIPFSHHVDQRWWSWTTPSRTHSPIYRFCCVYRTATISDMVCMFPSIPVF